MAPGQARTDEDMVIRLQRFQNCTTASSRPFATRTAIEKGHHHRVHRPFGMRQEHGAAMPQPDERSGARLPSQGARDLPRPGHLSTKIDPVAVRRHIGMVFQQPNPFAMSIFRNVAFGLRLNSYRGDMDERSKRRCAAPRSGTRSRTSCTSSGLALSGGQQQRLCIARAIATEPAVLLMDEPCSALDPIATHKIEELMKELKKKYTIAIVTHNLQQAKRVADMTGFLYVDTSAGRTHRLSGRVRQTQGRSSRIRERSTPRIISGGEFS